jgi:hypothetical protein
VIQRNAAIIALLGLSLAYASLFASGRLGFVLALMATAITGLIWRYLNLVVTNSPESLSPESNFVEELSRDRQLRIYTFFLFLGLIALLALQGANNEKEASDSNRNPSIVSGGAGSTREAKDISSVPELTGELSSGSSAIRAYIFSMKNIRNSVWLDVWFIADERPNAAEFGSHLLLEPPKGFNRTLLFNVPCDKAELLPKGDEYSCGPKHLDFLPRPKGVSVEEELIGWEGDTIEPIIRIKGCFYVIDWGGELPVEQEIDLKARPSEDCEK